jgi:hypothetical protein
MVKPMKRSLDRNLDMKVKVAKKCPISSGVGKWQCLSLLIWLPPQGLLKKKKKKKELHQTSPYSFYKLGYFHGNSTRDEGTRYSIQVDPSMEVN